MGFFQKLLGGGGKSGGKMTNLLEALIADLNLDQNQVAKIKEAFHAFKQERKSIKASGGDKAQIKQAKVKMTQQVISVLNDQQKQTFTTNAAKYDGILH